VEAHDPISKNFDLRASESRRVHAWSRSERDGAAAKVKQKPRPTRKQQKASRRRESPLKTRSSPGKERWQTSRLAVMSTVETYPADPLYPRIVCAVDAILARGKVVAPVDVLIGMHLLTPERLEDWRRGRVPYLEKVILCNLTRLSRLLRILRFHAHDLKLVPVVVEH
jgi:hypothetical protein